MFYCKTFNYNKLKFVANFRLLFSDVLIKIYFYQSLYEVFKVQIVCRA